MKQNFKSHKTRNAFVASLMAVILCVAMLVGTTFAWFTDSVTSGKNTITAGNLDIEVQYSKDFTDWTTVEDATDLFSDVTLWEPGATSVVYLKIINKGTLALKYNLGINITDETTGTNAAGDSFKLSDYIMFGQEADVESAYADRTAARTAVADSAQIISSGYTLSGSMTADADDKIIALVVYMPEETGNVANYMTGTTAPTIEMGVAVNATQLTSESDSFDNQYDAGAPWMGGTDDAGLTANTDTAAKTVKIASAEQLASFAKAVNGGNTYEGYTITLEKDIDLNNVSWTPIGNCYSDAEGKKAYNVFKGTFDGNNHTILNLNVEGGQENTPENAAKGLFGYTNSPAVIKNIKVNNATVSGSLFVGIIAGHAYTCNEISGIEITGDVKVTGYWYVGSVVGKTYLGSMSNVTVNANEGSFVKGVTPSNEAEDDAGNIGGVIGWTGEQNNETVYTGITIKNVDVSGISYVGGIVGHLHTNCVIKNSTVSDATVTGSELVGKIAGRYGVESGYGTVDDTCTATNVTLLTVIADGFTQDPSTGVYHISNANGLKYFASSVNNGNTYSGKTIQLDAAIDLNNEAWTPISGFNGTFDGQNKTISNLTVTGEKYVGLFGNVNGTIKNVNIKNATITGVTYVGTVVGKLYGTVTGCTVDTATITVNEDANKQYGEKAGAIVGFMGEGGTSATNNTVKDVTINGFNALGGVAGCTYGSDYITGNTVTNLTINGLTADGHDYREYTENQFGAVYGQNAGETGGSLQDNTGTNVTIIKLIADGLSKDLINNVYNISSATGFAYAAKNLMNAGGTYKLSSDIDMTDVAYTYPNVGATMTLDGNGKTISNLTVTGADASLLGEIQYEMNDASVTVKDLTLDGCSFTGTNVDDTHGAAAIVGNVRDNESLTISNVTVKNSSISGGKFAGGFVGFVAANGNGVNITGSTLDTCTLTTDYHEGTTYKGHLGGLIGFLYSTNPASNVTGNTVKDCTFVNNGGSERVGTLVGTHQGNEGSVTGNTVTGCTGCTTTQGNASTQTAS